MPETHIYNPEMALFISLSSASLFIVTVKLLERKEIAKLSLYLSTTPQRCRVCEGKVPYILKLALDDGGEQFVSSISSIFIFMLAC